MGTYQKSLRDVISLLDPDAKIGKSTRTAKAPAGKRARKVKQYKNPHTGEVIETKGGNHKTLKSGKPSGAPRPSRAGPPCSAKPVSSTKNASPVLAFSFRRIVSAPLPAPSSLQRIALTQFRGVIAPGRKYRRQCAALLLPTSLQRRLEGRQSIRCAVFFMGQTIAAEAFPLLALGCI